MYCIGGSPTVRLKRAEKARVLVRDPARLPGPTTIWRSSRVNWTCPATLAPAIDGVSRVFLLAPGPDVPAQDAAVITDTRASSRADAGALTIALGDPEMDALDTASRAWRA